MAIKYWEGWIKDDSKAPHEAISSAIENAEKMLENLKKLRPKALREVAQEIDVEVGKALKAFLKDASFSPGVAPGQLKLCLDDYSTRKFDILDIACEIAEWKQDQMVADFDSDLAKEAWAKKFEKAASLIRRGQLKPISK